MELRIELDDLTICKLAEEIAARIPERSGKLVYSTEEIAEELDTNVQKISLWRREGLLKGIRKGNGWIYRAEEVNRFLKLYEGLEIGNAEKCRKVKK